MSQVWMSNTNTYNAIAMSVSTMGYGANSNSRLLLFKVDGNTKFDLDTDGNIISKNLLSDIITANTLIINNPSTSISLNVISSNVITANTITSSNLISGNITVSKVITPSVGSSPDTGIRWPIDPGGGAGDAAFLNYYVAAGETTRFVIGTNNDADDTLSLYQFGADRLTIYNGNVGIDTSTPSSKLDVNGNANISGSLTVINVVSSGITSNTATFVNVSSNNIESNTVNAHIYFDSSNTEFYVNPAATSELFSANFKRPFFVPRYTLYFDATSSSRTTPNTFTKSYTASHVSFGSILGTHFRSFNVGGSFLFEMNVSCTSATSVSTYLMNIDDNIYFFLNKGQIGSSGGGGVNYPLTWNLKQGLNTIHIVYNNSGGGEGNMSYMADYFRNGNTTFISP